MAEIVVNAKDRTGRGKIAARRLRRQGFVPGVVYGGNGDNIAVSVDPKALQRVLRSEAGRNAILKLDITGKGATNAILTLPSVHGASLGGYSFVASNLLNGVTSAVANLTMIADETRPRVVAVFSTNDFNNIMVVFSEPVSATSATNIGHYTLSPGAVILSAQLVAPECR